MHAVFKQSVMYNLAAKRLQPLTLSLGAALGTLYARTHLVDYWREVVRSGEYSRLGVYAIEAYGHSQGVFYFVLFCFILRRVSCLSNGAAV